MAFSAVGFSDETDRYNNVKVEDRICELCDLDIEDEHHFVLAQYMLIFEKTGMIISLFSVIN